MLHSEQKFDNLLHLHDISMTRKYVIRIIVLARGKIVFDRTPSQLNDEALSAHFSTRKR